MSKYFRTKLLRTDLTRLGRPVVKMPNLSDVRLKSNLPIYISIFMSGAAAPAAGEVRKQFILSIIFHFGNDEIPKRL